MYCPKCGNENPDNTQSCNTCGVVFGAAPAADEPITPKTSGLAIAAFILGILGFFSCALTAIPAIICGIISLIKIEKSGGRITGKGFAIAGIVVPVFSFALMVLLLMPALSKVRAQAKQAVCLNNIRQLSLAWLIYYNENDGNIINGAAGLEKSNELPWIGRDWSSDHSSGQLLPESEQIQAIQDGALWPYCGSEDIDIYHCPVGLPGHLRTYTIVDSMNGIAREGTEEASGAFVTKITQLRRQAQRLVFIDVGRVIPETYAVYYNQQKWWDQPPVPHDNGTTVSFADGHSEYWKWRGKETIEHGKTAGFR